MKKNVLMFTLCSLFSFNAFGVGRFVEDIADLLSRSVRSSNEKIQREFDRTLDEALEITQTAREDIPADILDRLGDATLDPIGLIDPDSSSGLHLSLFFRPEYGHREELVKHIYSIFLQRRVNLNDTIQMARLAVLEDTYFGRRARDILEEIISVYGPPDRGIKPNV